MRQPDGRCCGIAVGLALRTWSAAGAGRAQQRAAADARRRSPKASAAAAAPRPPAAPARRASRSRRAPSGSRPAAVPSILDSRRSLLGKPGETTAFDARQRALVDRVSAYLSSVQQLIGNFVQVGPDGGKSEGEFYMQKPGKVRFEYDPPSPIDIIADGSSVVVRDRKLATQDLYPLSQTPLRFLLADRIDLLRDTNVIGVYADDVFVTVVIEEKQVARSAPAG